MDISVFTCNRCRQRLPVTTNASPILCPACDRISPNRTYERSSSRVHGKGWLNGRSVHYNNLGTESFNEIVPRSFGSFERRPRNRALLCGVSYKNNRKYKLKGTINDVINMRNLLIYDLQFPRECIRQLTENEMQATEEEQHPDLIPTKKNIEEGLQWLVEGCSSGDSLVFYFAGHSSQVKDNDGDERDGLDETICPLDFETAGMIRDDTINSAIVRPLTAGVTLHAIIDSCHSATVLDLPYVYDAKRGMWMDNRPPTGIYKGTSGGLAICISACRDDQKSVESSALSGKNTLTYNFIQELKKSPRLTYGDLLASVQNDIHEAIQAPGFKLWFLRTFFRSQLMQEIQLSSSEEFHVYGKQFKL